MKIGKRIALITRTPVADSKKQADLIKNTDEVTFSLPVYRLGKQACYFTNEVLFKLKEGTALSKVTGLIRSSIDSLTMSPYGYHMLTLKKGANVFAVANAIYESKFVEWSHPNFLAPIELKGVPPDPLFNNQYYLNNRGQTGGVAGIDINVLSAWDITLGSSAIRVSVVDDGVADHEDLSGRVLAGYTPVNGGDGSPSGADCQNGNRRGHGEAVTGIIAASQNTIGMSGIAPNAQIVPVNIFAGGETANDLANGINWAWTPSQGNADIISNSWGYNTTSSAGILYADVLIAAINAARTQGRVRNGSALGCIVVFASGNENENFSGVTFPANISGVITVGAISGSGNIWSYSSRGAEMDLVAPSGGATQNSNQTYLGCNIPRGDVYTTDRMGAGGYTSGNYTTTFNGTSAACPQVSGVAALMLSVAPDLTETQVRTILQQSATDMGDPGFDNTYGYGRLNALAAVSAARNTTTYIAGNKIVCSSNTYSIYNLPANASVSWSIPGNVGPGMTLTQNAPATNEATITNQKWYGISTTLTATVTVGGGTPVVYSLPIANDNSSNTSASYIQDACLCYNVSHASQTGTASTGSATFVHQCCDVRVTLNLPPNKTVTGVSGGTPTYWYYSGGILYFALPYGSGGIPFTFNIAPVTNDGSCSSSLLFFSYSNNGRAAMTYTVAPNPVGNTLQIIAKDNTALETDRSVSGQALKQTPMKKDNTRIQLHIKIFDVLNNKFVMAHKGQPGEFSQKINVSNLRPGIYTVVVDDGQQSTPVKFIKE